MRRCLCLLVVLALVAVGSASAAPIQINPPGGPWYDFLFFGPGVDATDGSGSSGSGAGDSIDAPSPPWTFSGPADLIVTDAFSPGDIFEIFDFGVSQGLTSLPVGVFGGTDTSDPNQTFPDPAFSSGVFSFGPGNHSITIQAQVSPFGAGGGFFQLVEAAAVPEPASMALWALASLGGVFYARRRKRRAA